MDFEKCVNPILDVDGVIENGTQFDLDIVLPEDSRDAIFGTVKDCHGCPVKNAVVKLIEVECENGKDVRKPVSHTFTDEEGEFVFGPLCPNKFFELQVWVNSVRHVKICARPERERKCLHGSICDKCDFIVTGKKGACDCDCKRIEE